MQWLPVAQAVTVGATSADELLASDIGGKTVKDMLDEANATIGGGVRFAVLTSYLLLTFQPT